MHQEPFDQVGNSNPIKSCNRRPAERVHRRSRWLPPRSASAPPTGKPRAFAKPASAVAPRRLPRRMTPPVGICLRQMLANEDRSDVLAVNPQRAAAPAVIARRRLFRRRRRARAGDALEFRLRLSSSFVAEMLFLVIVHDAMNQKSGSPKFLARNSPVGQGKVARSSACQACPETSIPGR